MPRNGRRRRLLRNRRRRALEKMGSLVADTSCWSEIDCILRGEVE